MGDAVRITENIVGKAGDSHGYALSVPFHGVDHVIVSRIDMAAWGLQETRIVPAQLIDGQVVMLATGDNTMAVSIPMPLCSHAEALASIGYVETIPEPEPEPEPVDPPDEAA